MKAIIMSCTKNNFIQDKWVILCPKMAHPHNCGWALRIFLKFCRMKGANRCKEILLVIFWEKFVWGNLIFLAFRPLFTSWLGMVKLQQATVNWILKQSGHDLFHEYYRFLKQWRHDFSGKPLCDGYCMDIMLSLCVEVKIHGFIKLL